MRIAPISSLNSPNNYKPNFNAALYVQQGSYAKADEITYDRFSTVMDKFKKKLADDPLHPEDVVVVSPIKHNTEVKTARGKVNANLKVSIDEYSSDFYYNSDRSTDSIAQDLYNTYKHVRYLRHYT